MSADLTPTGGDLAPTGGEAAPADYLAAPEMVKVMRERHPELCEIPESILVQALAEVLPVYGAMVQVRTFGADYARREQRANSMTTRVYGVSLLLRVAAEAEADANAGIDPADNRAAARVLRARAHREGRS